ncbi:MAG: nucleotidyltransferase family protein [Vulcanimicrobiota bacterium]
MSRAFATVLRAARGQPVGPPELLEGEWGRLTELLVHHGLLVPVAREWLAEEVTLPGRVRDFLLRAQRQHALRASQQLQVLTSLAEQSPIPILAYKGLPLSALLYGDPLERSSSDIDILIHPADLQPAVKFLERLGFRQRLPRPLEGELLALLARTGNELSLEWEGVSLDLHWRLLPTYLSCLTTEELFERSQVWQCGSTAVRVLSPRDRVAAICLHATKSCWEKLRWLRDLDAAREVAQVNSPSGRAEELGWRLLNLLERSPADPWESSLLESWCHPRGRGPGQRRLMIAHSLGRRWSALRFLTGFAVTPTALDYSSRQLPRALWGLYPFLRLWSLVVKGSETQEKL